MLKDRYDNPLTTTSQSARDAYTEGVDLILSANAGGDRMLQRGIEAPCPSPRARGFSRP